MNGKTLKSTKPRYMTGKITYRLHQIKKRLIDDAYKFNHDDALNITSKWFHNATVDENIAVVSNYPWVYKNKSEILDNIEEYKILVIPPLSIFGRMSLPKIRSSILHDKYARLNEIVKLVHAGHDLQKHIKAVIAKNEEFECQVAFNYILESVTQLFNDHVGATSTKQKWVNVTNHQLIAHVPNRLAFSSVEQWLQSQIDTNIHCLKEFRNIPMKSNIKLISMLQGRRSLIRKIIPKKVKAFRGQILLRPELKPNEIILPYIWADILNISPVRLVDVSTPNFSPPECFTHLSNSARLLVKRDPAINGASISGQDTVGFARTDNIYVGTAELEQKNADFDGDTESAFIVTDPRAIKEIDLNIMPQNNMRIFQQVYFSHNLQSLIYNLVYYLHFQSTNLIYSYLNL